MVIRRAVRAGTGVLLVLAVTACSGAAAAPSTPVAPAAALAPTAVPIESAQPTETAAPTDTAAPIETAAPTSSPAPIKSHKPLPSIDQSQLDAFLTSSITLIDLADSGLGVTVSFMDPSSTDVIDLGTYVLESSDQTTNQVPPGRYRLDFRQPANSATKTSCTIEIADAGSYVFAAVNDAIAISRTGVKPKDARELFVSTSSLCGK